MKTTRRNRRARPLSTKPSRAAGRGAPPPQPHHRVVGTQGEWAPGDDPEVDSMNHCDDDSADDSGEDVGDGAESDSCPEPPRWGQTDGQEHNDLCEKCKKGGRELLCCDYCNVVYGGRLGSCGLLSVRAWSARVYGHIQSCCWDTPRGWFGGMYGGRKEILPHILTMDCPQ